MGFNNTFSIFQAFKSLGCKVELSNKISKNFDLLILPGVGSFVEGMNSLKKQNLIIILKIMYTANKKILGICLGMQLFFSESSEFKNKRT